jgi:hypothetical protein
MFNSLQDHKLKSVKSATLFGPSDCNITSTPKILASILILSIKFTMQTQTSREKNGGKFFSSHTTTRLYVRMLLVGLFAGIFASRQYTAVTHLSSPHHDSSDASFAPPLPPNEVIVWAKELLRNEKRRDAAAAAANATNNLRANVDPENTTRSSNVVPANTPPVSPTEAERKVEADIKDVGSHNHINKEEVVATKTPPLGTSASTRSITTAAGSEIKDFERQKGVVIG